VGLLRVEVVVDMFPQVRYDDTDPGARFQNAVTFANEAERVKGAKMLDGVLGIDSVPVVVTAVEGVPHVKTPFRPFLFFPEPEGRKKVGIYPSGFPDEINTASKIQKPGSVRLPWRFSVKQTTAGKGFYFERQRAV
jgi:hypothetical protein